MIINQYLCVMSTQSASVISNRTPISEELNIAIITILALSGRSSSLQAEIAHQDLAECHHSKDVNFHDLFPPAASLDSVAVFAYMCTT